MYSEFIQIKRTYFLHDQHFLFLKYKKGDQVQNVIDFFVGPLIFPVYVGLALYGFAWIGARFFADVFARHIGSDPSAIELGAIRAWRLVIILHLLLGLGITIGLSVHALPKVSEWVHILWYLVSFLPFLILDACILITLSSHSKTIKKATQREKNSE